SKPNIALMQYNWRDCYNRDRVLDEAHPAFCWPGYERAARRNPYAIADHDTGRLLPWTDSRELVVDARLRFNTNACLMARFDDEAIASRLEQFFGANQGHCAVRPSAKLLAEGRNSIYERAPLRERSEKEEWRMRLEPTLQFQN